MRLREPGCFGLVTRNDVRGRNRELEEYLGGFDLPPDTAETLEAARLASSNFRERILSEIMVLPLTRLMAHLTTAHEIVIDKYSYEQSMNCFSGTRPSPLRWAIFPMRPLVSRSGTFMANRRGRYRREALSKQGLRSTMIKPSLISE